MSLCSCARAGDGGSPVGGSAIGGARDDGDPFPNIIGCGGGTGGWSRAPYAPYCCSGSGCRTDGGGIGAGGIVDARGSWCGAHAGCGGGAAVGTVGGACAAAARAAWCMYCAYGPLMPAPLAAAYEGGPGL